MNILDQTHEFFFHQQDWDKKQVIESVERTLDPMDDGELYLEVSQSEKMIWSAGRLESSQSSYDQGFGLRGVLGECVGYAYGNEFDLKALSRAADVIGDVKDRPCGKVNLGSLGARPAISYWGHPLKEISFRQRVNILQKIDDYVRSKSPHVQNVIISLSGQWSAIEMIRIKGQCLGDIRPLVCLNISVILEKNQRSERGGQGYGGRYGYDVLLNEKHWKEGADDALKMAEINLESRPAPCGEMTVVLGSGWPGVLLHEAVGHGLEGDFIRKKTSVFSSLLGQKVASESVSVLDEGTFQNARGSLSIDDEGTPTQQTVLIENGILKGFMQDRLNGRLMGMPSTGNGRRQSYAHEPMPRMTNTYMKAGDRCPEDIIKSVDKGIYAVQFGGGQVDITSGKFVFSCTQAYEIENGRLGSPIKGATLIGHGADVLKRVSQVGHDMALDKGVGTCGKEGQSVPVCVGQPTMRIEALTVGGTG